MTTNLGVVNVQLALQVDRAHNLSDTARGVLREALAGDVVGKLEVHRLSWSQTEESRLVLKKKKVIQRKTSHRKLVLVYLELFQLLPFGGEF